MNSSDPNDRRATLRLDARAPDDLARAGALLRAGELVAFPTETVYGLGADATDPRAVAGIYAAKERPRFNPLIAHLADHDGAMREGVFDDDARRLAARFWPGPLTLVVPVAVGGRVCDLARAGLASVALRVPGSEVARALIAAVGRPVAAPSANRSGQLSPTEAAHVLGRHDSGGGGLDGRVAAVLDGGPTGIGVESTIVMVLPGEAPRLLRPGGAPRGAIEQVLGRVLAEAPAGGEAAGAPLSPGLLASHYAPRARVRLAANEIRPGEGALLFGGVPRAGLDGARLALDLSPAGDLGEAAANLFGHLHRLDATGAPGIAVAPIPRVGLGEAINDRLERAAAER